MELSTILYDWKHLLLENYTKIIYKFEKLESFELSESELIIWNGLDKYMNENCEYVLDENVKSVSSKIADEMKNRRTKRIYGCMIRQVMNKSFGEKIKK